MGDAGTLTLHCHSLFPGFYDTNRSLLHCKLPTVISCLPEEQHIHQPETEGPDTPNKPFFLVSHFYRVISPGDRKLASTLRESLCE